MSLSLEDIDKLVNDMENEAKAIKSNLFKFCWYMRGSVSISEIYEMDIQDRDVISGVIDDNLKIVKDTGLPFF